MRASLGTTNPEARAIDPAHGTRAVRALGRALLAASSFIPLGRLIGEVWLSPQPMAAGSECALLSAVVGATLGWDEQRLAELALAALVADIGMSFLRSDLTLKPGPLSADERRRLRTHATLGEEALSFLEQIAPIVPRVALEHHERHDGQGYPNRLRGRRIADEAQIVAVIQRYLAAMAVRPHRPGLPPHEAAEVLMSPLGSLAPDVLDAFRTGVAIYPVGSSVRLSGGEGGRVIPGGMPTRPTIEILWDQNGEPVVPYEIDLMLEHVTFVTAFNLPLVGDLGEADASTADRTGPGQIIQSASGRAARTPMLTT